MYSFAAHAAQVVSFLLLNLYLHLAWCLHSIVNSETVSEASLSSLLSKRNTFFEQLEYFLSTFTEREEVGKHGNQLACRVSNFFNQSSTTSRWLTYFAWCFWGLPHFFLIRYLLCARFVPYLPKRGFCLERQIILRQSWKD